MPDEEDLVTDVEGLRWFDTVAFLLADALAGDVATRVGAVLLLVTADVFALPDVCDELTLLTLLLVPAPALVETLLVNTRSDPVYLLFPCH